jgi:hypothetical protein
MPLCNNGAIIVAATLIGDGSITNLASGNAYLGVGDSTTAFSAAQTDLQASSNKLRKLATSVSRAGAVLTFVTTYGTSEGNFAWEEVGLFNASSGAASMVSRKVQSLGTKTSASSWQLTLTATVSA